MYENALLEFIPSFEAAVLYMSLFIQYTVFIFFPSSSIFPHKCHAQRLNIEGPAIQQIHGLNPWQSHTDVGLGLHHSGAGAGQAVAAAAAATN